MSPKVEDLFYDAEMMLEGAAHGEDISPYDVLDKLKEIRAELEREEAEPCLTTAAYQSWSAQRRSGIRPSKAA